MNFGAESGRRAVSRASVARLVSARLIDRLIDAFGSVHRAGEWRGDLDAGPWIDSPRRGVRVADSALAAVLLFLWAPLKRRCALPRVAIICAQFPSPVIIRVLAAAGRLSSLSFLGNASPLPVS